MNRRAFLTAAAFSAVALRSRAIAQSTTHALALESAEVPPLTSQLLNLVNAERAAVALTPLQLDPLACTVAEKHAIEMARYDFLSHWGRDGRKPYHRYSFAGGIEAIHENDGAIDSTAPFFLEDASDYLVRMHKSMHDEAPPHDGHRQAILDRWNTHVGFGYAIYGYSIRLCELYVARYISIDRYSPTAVRRGRFLLSGRVLETKYSVQSIDVYYEPLPTPPGLDWLRILRPYGLPNERETLLPKAPGNYIYDNGSRGSIQLQPNGRFTVPISLRRREPGIYTVVVWIRSSSSDAPFPATQVCVRAE